MVKKIYTSMEEFLDEDGDNDLPFPDICKKIIQIFSVYTPSVALRVFKTTITGNKMSGVGDPYTVAFHNTWCVKDVEYT